jgi:hypothetical protein
VLLRVGWVLWYFGGLRTEVRSEYMGNSLESDRQWLRNLVAAIEASTAGSTELPIPDIHSLLPRLTLPIHSRRLPLQLDDCSLSTSDALGRGLNAKSP